MTTHERELVDPVDLCTPDGGLNPAAMGWSRRPLHRANLVGEQGRNKRWDYWAVLAGDVLVSAVYADIDHVGLADIWWADLGSGRTGGGGVIVGSDAVSLTKIGRELTWDYDWDDPMAPWRITDPDGQLDVTLTSRHDKHSRPGRDEGFGSETHQVFGTFAGTVRTDDGPTIEFDELQGFAEEARQRW